MSQLSQEKSILKVLDRKSCFGILHFYYNSNVKQLKKKSLNSVQLNKSKYTLKNPTIAIYKKNEEIYIKRLTYFKGK